MLKWTVGPRKTPTPSHRTPASDNVGPCINIRRGVNRSTSLSVGPCLNIRRAAARLHLRRSTPTSATSRRTTRSSGRGKENNSFHNDEILSPRTRDSVYMRLDALPAALRDVSNRITTPGSTGSPQKAPGSGVKRPRSRHRSRPSLPARLEQQKPTPESRSNEVLTSLPSLSTSEDSVKRPALQPLDESSQNCVNNTLVRQRLAEQLKPKRDLDCQIDYSPCPLRATRSLVALRRRLADAFINPTLSVGTMPRDFDNPIYFAVEPSPKLPFISSSIDLNEENSFSTIEKELDSTPECLGSQELSTKRDSEPGSVLEEKNITLNSNLSPITRHLSTLKLNEVGFKSELLQKSPSPLVPISCLDSQKPLINHDVTDPKFLSRFSLIDSSNLALMRRNDNRVEGETKPDDKSDNCSSDEPLVNKSPINDSVERESITCSGQSSEARKRNSTCRVRTVSEDGPPLKAQPIMLSNGHLAMPATNHNVTRGNDLLREPIKTPSSPKDALRIRLTSKRRRKSDRRRTKSQGEEDEVEECLRGLGDGIFTSTTNCDSLFNDLDFASHDSSQEEFTLKRQGCIRRRRHLLTEENQDPNARHFGLTLPLELPSPFSPDNARSWYARVQGGPPQSFSNITLQGNYSIAPPKAKDVSSLHRKTDWSQKTNTANNSSNCIGLPLGPPTSWSSIRSTKRVAKTKRTDINQFSNTNYLETHLTTAYVTETETTTTTTTDFIQESRELPEMTYRTKRFGLTLSNGIPSPPTPVLQDPEIPGVMPIRPSPAVKSFAGNDNLWKSNMDSSWKGSTETMKSSNEAWKGSTETFKSSSETWRGSGDTWKGSIDNWRGSGDTWKSTVKSVNEMADEESISDETWNSHNMQEAATDDGMTGCNSQDDVEMVDKDSFASVAPSPQAVVESRSRSRRCLRFTSPGGSMRQRRASRRLTPWKRTPDEHVAKGELDLEIYENSGLVTIHVIAGKHLHKAGGRRSNAYVKVALVPSSEERTFHRTSVHRDSSAPRFDQKFAFELLEPDLDKRILVSVWHRDKDRRRSEFLGCMSFAVKHAVKKEVSGTYRLLSQTAGASHSQNVSSSTDTESNTLMARHSDSSVEEIISLEECDIPPPPVAVERRRAPPPPKKSMTKTTTSTSNNDDSSFLRHLELEPSDEPEASTSVTSPSVATATPPVALGMGNKGGRTPFTTTRHLTRHGGAGFGFSIAWTQPPRIERVEPNQPADQAGLRPGDYVIFVGKDNVVTLGEEEILRLIRSCGNHLTLEVYRRANSNGLVKGDAAAAKHRASITCSAATTTSLDLSKRRLHLPQVTFSSEAEPLNRADSRRRAVYQLVNKEQHYALCLQFGVSRFLLPLSERKDIISIADHLVLFQNIEELLRLTEDILDQLVQEDHEPLGHNLGRVYLRKIPIMTAAYRRYCSALKQADCLLVTKTKNNDFMKLITEPVIPRRRPDLTAFLHKPLEHYREILKLLQTVLNFTKVTDEDHPAISRVVQELQATYREITVGAGLMEPEGEGRLLLSLQDLESRLVFTRCKPFVLSAPGRQWIFGGDLARVEGRAVRPFWGLLFSDMILFAKVSRDRVLFITEEPLSLLAVTQACFQVKKKATDFRLLMDGGPEGDVSPVPAKCGPDMTLSRQSKKNLKRRTVSLRAPTPELKAVWQNLIQRQIIYLNTARGGTPTSSPLESPDQPTTLSFATLDSLSLRRQTPMADTKSLSNSQRHLDDLIEHKCRQLGKSGANKGSALHLSQWMRGQLGGGPLTPDDEPITEVWSPRTLRRRSEQLQLIGIIPGRCESRTEDFDVSDTEARSPTHSVDSQVTVRSPEQKVNMCRQCHNTCLAHAGEIQGLDDEPDYDDNDGWGPLMLMGMTALKATIGLGSRSAQDPFSPAEVPNISVLPPTPEVNNRSSSGFQWDDADLSSMAVRGSSGSRSPDNTLQIHEEESEDHDGELEEDSTTEFSLRDEQDPPYRSLSSSSGLKRFGTLASLEMYTADDSEVQDEEEDPAEDSTDSEEEEEEWDSEQEETNSDKAAEQNFEVVTQSLRGWTARAGSFVAEKMALFERLGEDSRAAAFLDRYWRPAPDAQEAGGSPPSGVGSSGGVEDECSNSVATSGEEVWGTPTSGGELLDEELARAGTSYESPRGSISSPGPLDDNTELMMDDLLATSSMIATSRFPTRRRLEPLVEEEDVESSESTPCSAPTLDVTETPSPEQGKRAPGVAADNYLARVANVSQLTAADILRHQPPSFFQRLSLRKTREEQPPRVKTSRLLGFLSMRRSTTEVSSSSGRPLFRIFGRDAVDDIPTTLPARQASLLLETASKNSISNHYDGVGVGGGKLKNADKDKQLERRFWKQLRRRRSSGSSSGASSPPQTVT